MRYLLFFCVFSSIIIFIGIFSILWKFSPDLPSYEKIRNYQPNLSSRIYTSDGVLLKSFFVEERLFVPIDRIPKLVSNAFIAAEDKKFYSHYGIDILAIIRASINNFFSLYNNSKLIGASTITQQVVKNLLLTNEVTFERKIKEILLSIRIENILSKNEILELYLNDIYLGYGSYGITTASLNYFNKSLQELELHEVAFLAALPKAPNNYNPDSNYDNAISRRNWVIDKMFANGFISYEDLHYKNKPLVISKRTINKFNRGEYFYEEIRKKLYKNYGKNKLYSQGLIIKTTIDTEYQKIAEEVLINGLIEYDKRHGWRGGLQKKLIGDNKVIKNPFPNKWEIVKIIEIQNDELVAEDKLKNIYKIDLNSIQNEWLKKSKFFIGDLIYLENISSEWVIRQLPDVNGAILVLNPHNGDVLALSGGLSYDLSEFNRVTQAKRQPGSAYKPFVYITALKEGYNPSTLVLDAPYVVDQGPGLPKWKPANYTEKFYGLNTMRTGIEKSRNLMTIRLADKIGMKKILLTSKDFNLDKYLDENLSMALGSGLTTLFDISNAYGIIVNGGKEIKPNMIKSIYDKHGNRILINEIKECVNCKLKNLPIKYEIPKIINNQKNLLDKRIAYQITSMLEGVVKRGTGKKLKSLETPLAGKTGTTNDNKDAWFIGFSPDLVIGVYVGYDKPKSLGYKETGSSVALPIFKSFVKEANVNKNKIPFRIPSGLSFVKINPKSGLPSNDSNSVLEPYIIGTEPFYNNNINILDSLGSINNDSISGTGGLLED